MNSVAFVYRNNIVGAGTLPFIPRVGEFLKIEGVVYEVKSVTYDLSKVQRQPRPNPSDPYVIVEFK